MKPNSKKKYITLNDGGCDFRQMSKIMTKAGYKMNHATCRNILIVSLDSLFVKIGSLLNANVTSETIENLRNNQEIHNILSDILYLAYEELKKEENDKSK